MLVAIEFACKSIIPISRAIQHSHTKTAEQFKLMCMAESEDILFTYEIFYNSNLKSWDALIYTNPEGLLDFRFEQCDSVEELNNATRYVSKLFSALVKGHVRLDYFELGPIKKRKLFAGDLINHKAPVFFKKISSEKLRVK